mmetsp:Transcript_783/g.980  ORF Transcript_783/g.980 Transcript_783/m.980 type:complete len:84 (-) Transcript_783:72-323(-)
MAIRFFVEAAITNSQEVDTPSPPIEPEKLEETDHKGHRHSSNMKSKEEQPGTCSTSSLSNFDTLPENQAMSEMFMSQASAGAQ